MSNSKKSRDQILSKLNIESLNPMQEQAVLAIHAKSGVVLLSPTGTGKTLAFLIPVIEQLDDECKEIQILILVPSRELAIQIEQVIREMGTGYKTNAVYGGKAGSIDKQDLKHRPAILVGTPGRVADHIRRESFSCESIKTLVLDEFDKSLEVGFESEMKEIIKALPGVHKKVLTSATEGIEIPKFIDLTQAFYINFLHQTNANLSVKAIVAHSKDKLECLYKSLNHIGNQPGIIFCNFKDTIQFVSGFLQEKQISHGCFYGGMEQKDRERSLIKFRNGTYQLLITTDLAARGIDVPEIKFIIHYQLPSRLEEYTHRNGRTARMNNEGTAYVLKWEQEELPSFIGEIEEEKIQEKSISSSSAWATLFISGGRRDKISKGDIAGLFMKQGGLKSDEVGLIEIKQDCAFVGVPATKVDMVIANTNNVKLKKRKVRISVA